MLLAQGPGSPCYQASPPGVSPTGCPPHDTGVPASADVKVENPAAGGNRTLVLYTLYVILYMLVLFINLTQLTTIGLP